MRLPCPASDCQHQHANRVADRTVRVMDNDDETLDELRQEIENLRMYFLLTADVIAKIGRHHGTDPDVREGLAALRTLADVERRSRSTDD